MAAYLNQRSPALELISPWIEKRGAATSILVYAEVTEYMRGLSNPDQRQLGLRDMLGDVYPYFLTYPILERYADIRRQLRPPFGPGLIGDIDTLIAATAIERNVTLVTMDRDFERVPGLELMLVDLRA